MIIVKLINYMTAFVKTIFYKLLYGKKFKYGKKFTFRNSFYLMIDKNAKVHIGDNCFFNNYCSITAINLVEIGDGTIFGENVKIYDHNHRFSKKNVLIKEQGYSSAPIKIGKHCWIGSNVTILKGTSIGDNCVIGAGCVLNGIIESNSMLVNTSNYIIREIVDS